MLYKDYKKRIAQERKQHVEDNNLYLNCLVVDQELSLCPSHNNFHYRAYLYRSLSLESTETPDRKRSRVALSLSRSDGPTIEIFTISHHVCRGNLNRKEDLIASSRVGAGWSRLLLRLTCCADIYASILIQGLPKGGSREPVVENVTLWSTSGATLCWRYSFQIFIYSYQYWGEENFASVVRQFWKQEEVPSLGLTLSKEDQ